MRLNIREKLSFSELISLSNIFSVIFRIILQLNFTKQEKNSYIFPPK